MAKNIIKEIIIVLLLALAIILILGVLLYEYVPSNKIVPEQISYVTPEKARQEIADMELNSDILDENSIPPYTISAADLKKDGESFDEVGKTDSDVSVRYTDKADKAFTAYYYRVKAYKKVGEKTFISKPSKSVRVKTK